MAVAAAALSLGGCQRGGGGNAEPMNFKKLTNGKAVYRGEEAGLRHYAVTLWTNGHSTAAVDNYKDADISLALELVTAASGAEAQIASGEYLFSADAQAGVILASAQSTLSVFTEYSYGGDRQALSGGSVTVSFYNGKYEIKGSVTDVWDRVLEFTYYGEIAFKGTGPVEPETTTVTFEAAELSAATGTYSDILWGREQAVEVDGSQVYNGLLYTEGAASFGSYYAYDGTWESWGGFALSANRDLEDLGMDYSNQFSVYASDNTKFAVGYAFGDWGGEYGVPVIEFLRTGTAGFRRGGQCEQDLSLLCGASARRRRRERRGALGRPRRHGVRCRGNADLHGLLPPGRRGAGTRNVGRFRPFAAGRGIACGILHRVQRRR